MALAQTFLSVLSNNYGCGKSVSSLSRLNTGMEIILFLFLFIKVIGVPDSRLGEEVCAWIK